MEERKGDFAQTKRLVNPRLVVAAVALALVIWFAVDNRRQVTIDWFVFDTETPLFVVIVVSALLGAAIDRLVRWRRTKR
jgi:uncharacterized integral membrane protein